MIRVEDISCPYIANYKCKYPVILELDTLPRIVRESQKYEEVWVDHKGHGNDPFLVIVWYRNR